MSISHFWLANSAVHTTSASKPSHSPDFARWRWMNWLRCSSADSGNSSSLAVMPGLSALNFFTPSLRSPEVSLPVQYVTVPLAPSIADASRVFAPLVAPVDLEPLDELLLSSPPHAATPNAQAIVASNAANLNRLLIA